MFYIAASKVIRELVYNNQRLLNIIVNSLAVNGPSYTAEAAAEYKNTAANTFQVT